MDRHRLLAALAFFLAASRVFAQPLPGTKPLTDTDDLATKMVAGIDKYLMRELAESPAKRQPLWKLDPSSPEAYLKSVEPNRARLAKILGLVDKRVPANLEYVSTAIRPGPVSEGNGHSVYAVRWSVLDGVDAEGLLLEPARKGAVANVVAIPDADCTPEMLAGLAPGLTPEEQFARRLAEAGCRVLVPTLIDRKDSWSGSERAGRSTNQPHREFIYRQAYEMGRHVIGYEVQKVLAAVDWFTRDKSTEPVGVIGHGEGGMLALYSGALDRRIKATVVSGYFGPREEVWREPIYRNVWGLLTEFGDAELTVLYEPGRDLIVDVRKGPEIAGPPPARGGRSGAAPGTLAVVTPEAAAREAKRIRARAPVIPAGRGDEKVLDRFLASLGGKMTPPEEPRANADPKFDPAPRQKRQFDQLCAFTQQLQRDSAARRDQSWSRINPRDYSPAPEKWDAACQPYRDYFWTEVIGKLPAPSEPANPLSRLTYDEPKWKGYEVKLDLYPDVFAYGILLVPKDLKPGERRPVVVCQHGLEGRPQDVVNPKVVTPYYKSFGARLAELGYVVYAPQNPYVGKDRFRVLQRKANPLKLSLFSFIIRQHERTLDWLAGLPFVDDQRIAFYGLSYGGKTAMRVPAVLHRYCLSICSGDFNEWIWKNVNLTWAGSYVFTNEYEMYEFDLGNTFNYAEMAALIAPRPFMVERGHDDGVGLDEYVAFEYAKVRRTYSRLGIPDRTEIEFFAGGHEIHEKGTFAFLAKHLKWAPR